MRVELVRSVRFAVSWLRNEFDAEDVGVDVSPRLSHKASTEYRTQPETTEGASTYTSDADRCVGAKK